MYHIGPVGHQIVANNLERIIKESGRNGELKANTGLRTWYGGDIFVIVHRW